jgi:hypothetical protein
VEGKRRTRLALLGLGLCLAAPFAYYATMGVPVLLRTGAICWALLAAGLLAGGVAARGDRRLGLRLLAGVDAAIALLWAVGFFGLASLPAPEGAERLETAPEFSLPDAAGGTVALAEARASGPVLLVFFRGVW